VARRKIRSFPPFTRNTVPLGEPVSPGLRTLAHVTETVTPGEAAAAAGTSGHVTFPHAGPDETAVAWTARLCFVNEARLGDAGSGLAPVTEGWFVVNVRDAEWFSSETRGAACWFANEYGESPIEFAQFGINVTVLEPGQSSVYHAEANQEDFLVLAGECRLLVEGEERLLRAWDFFHSPPWTDHAFVGAGDELCVILMVGAHVSPEVRYPVSDLAARYGASVEKETSDPEEVYATAERFRRQRPSYWSRLPWG
jgi:uncharacterized cupin superfamily protein